MTAGAVAAGVVAVLGLFVVAVGAATAWACSPYRVALGRAQDALAALGRALSAFGWAYADLEAWDRAEWPPGVDALYQEHVRSVAALVRVIAVGRGLDADSLPQAQQAALAVEAFQLISGRPVSSGSSLVM
ncbi:hypothetical protein [Actinocorallia sp. A-T 12471]|uniref:hypothetical protein n=1 Tax=Actinocorallia sp. A-T 12471 TaxID=3089813 RepID=UPI0029CFF881|nr:hypothetical protein [Actinocorallia sp. A-T 12471]MDX6742835.1 hypothetical protein [Actinocorallia sp. A-T 12471]